MSITAVSITDKPDVTNGRRGLWSALKILLVCALHGGVIYFLLLTKPPVSSEPEPLRMAVRLLESAPPLPAETPPTPMTALPTKRPKEKSQPKPVMPAVLAAAHQAVANDSSFAVVAPPSAAPPTAPQVASQAAPPVVAARFDADYLKNPAPLYPPVSRRRSEEGKVFLLVHVSVQGAAEQVEIKQSSGFARLDEAALSAVRQWRFIPARRGDQPVAATVVVPIVFRLES